MTDQGCFIVGGSGGGGGAAGGKASYQAYVGSPASYSSMYTPREYGGYGGAGGGLTSDLRCTYTAKQSGGEGGMCIEMQHLATNKIINAISNTKKICLWSSVASNVGITYHFSILAFFTVIFCHSNLRDIYTFRAKIVL